MPKNTLLLILDGWGYRAIPTYNAIKAARTPNWDHLIETAPKTLIRTYGKAVGLPSDQMGNSEVGHMNLGAGRVVYQTLTRIDEEVETGAFGKKPLLLKALETLKAKGGALHIAGLCSDGGIHSHINHIEALCKAADAQGLPIRLHAFTDGRDTPPEIAETFINRIETLFKSLKDAKIASVSGRYFAMDRDNRWDRVELAYLAMSGKGETAPSALEAVKAARARKETDEFIKPTAILDSKGQPYAFKESDGLIFMNFRSDRAREISAAWFNDDFTGFKTSHAKLSVKITLAEYSDKTQAEVLYPPETLANHFGEWISKKGLTQLRIAETEKYAHVTFFFNGGQEATFKGEDRILVPSPKVATYDLKPEMSLPEVTDKLVEAISTKKYDAIICNFANPDMVGHTGDFMAAIKAVECVDQALGRVMKALEETDGQMLVTADHGNAEQMWDDVSNAPMTQHTLGDVRLIYFGKKKIEFEDSFLGSLANVAPTLLDLMGLDKPSEMTAPSLLKK